MARRQPASLQAQPWWTPADQGELTLLANEFTRAALTHKECCPGCGPTGWCPQMRDAYTAVDEWRTSRILQSKAAWLRTGQNLAEWERMLWPDGRPALRVVGDEAA